MQYKKRTPLGPQTHAAPVFSLLQDLLKLTLLSSAEQENQDDNDKKDEELAGRDGIALFLLSMETSAGMK
jgi:hypothetical protein